MLLLHLLSCIHLLTSVYVGMYVYMYVCMHMYLHALVHVHVCYIQDAFRDNSRCVWMNKEQLVDINQIFHSCSHC